MQRFPDNERFRKLLFSYPGKAIQFLYQFFYDDLIRVSVRLTHDRKASEDILQEVFFHVWKKHEWLGQHHEKPIELYLAKMVQNKSISFYHNERKIEEWKVRYRHHHRATYIDVSVEDRLISLEIISHIRKLIASFPRREQQCYLWSRDEEMSNKQIAGVLKITEKAVERSITSAKKRLRKHWLAFGAR